MQFPQTSEVPEHFEGQHMWQMGSKLEAPWLLYFHSDLSTPSLHCITDGGNKTLKSPLRTNILCFTVVRSVSEQFPSKLTTTINFSNSLNKSTESPFTLCHKVGNTCRQLLSSVTVSFYINLSHTRTFLQISLSRFTPRSVNVSCTILERYISLYLDRGASEFKVSHLKQRSCWS